MNDNLWLWIGFNTFVLFMLALDLGVFHRKTHVVSFKESIFWTILWVVLAMVFNVGLWYCAGPEKGLEFLLGYVIEKSLSIDNVFIFALIFSSFAVPSINQHKVLFWGVLGALVMRAIMIGVGAALISKFTWVMYIFGAFLVVTGIRMLFTTEGHTDFASNPWVRRLRRLIPFTPNYHGERFFVKKVGLWHATPLFLVLLIVEFADVIFAVDSIPAIFAVSKDPFIVYTSNVFAILGLRSLYFALAGSMAEFHYLKTGLGVVLAFVGVKMLLGHTAWKIDPVVSLVVIVTVLAISVVASRLRQKPIGDAPNS